MWRPVADQGLFPREITQGRHKVPVVNDWFVFEYSKGPRRPFYTRQANGMFLRQLPGTNQLEYSFHKEYSPVAGRLPGVPPARWRRPTRSTRRAGHHTPPLEQDPCTAGCTRGIVVGRSRPSLQCPLEGSHLGSRPAGPLWMPQVLWE